jgi:hypothetical protein
MSRYVKPLVLGIGKQQEGGNGEFQQYLERVASYIPAEVTALYAAAVGAAAAEANPSWRIGLEIFVFVAAFIFAGFPLYGKGKDDPARYRRIQIGIAMGAFVVWAYALNIGIVFEFHLYHMAIALVALFAVSAIAGRYQPKKSAPPPAPRPPDASAAGAKG